MRAPRVPHKDTVYAYNPASPSSNLGMESISSIRSGNEMYEQYKHE